MRMVGNTMIDTRHKRILLVDDDEDHLFLEKSFLQRIMPDLEIESATSGKECLERIKNDNFDCIVSDYNIGPGVGGLELLKSLRKMNVEVPFFFFSSQDISMVKKEASKYGAMGFISKNHHYNNFQIVAAKIDRIIERRRRVA